METCSIQGLFRAAMEGQGHQEIHKHFLGSKESLDYLASARGADEGSTPSMSVSCNACAEL